MSLVARLVVALVLIASPAWAAMPDLASARSFVERVYAAYHGAGPDYLGRQAKAVFSPRILALLRRDAALTPKGDVGALDGDPICDCQDFAITDVRVDVQAAGAGRATATVRFRNFRDPFTTRLDLVTVGGEWRIDNIHSKSTPDLARYLERHAGGR
jgi:hypothetical protein